MNITRIALSLTSQDLLPTFVLAEALNLVMVEGKHILHGVHQPYPAATNASKCLRGKLLFPKAEKEMLLGIWGVEALCV